jgi:hypothetical protein
MSGNIGHFTGNDSISPGTVISVVVISVLLVVALAAIVPAVLAIKADVFVFEDIPNGFLIIVGIAIILVTCVGFGFGMYPYSYNYHHYREYTGTVTRTDSRLVNQDKVLNRLLLSNLPALPMISHVTIHGVQLLNRAMN